MNKREPELFKAERTCCACGVSEEAWKREQRSTNIVSIFPMIYARAIGTKGTRKMGPGVMVCESCLIRLLAGSIDSGAMNLFHGILGSLRKSYNAYLESL